MRELTHLDTKGRASMVDVSAKARTRRMAVASARIRMHPAALQSVATRGIANGDLIAVSRIAGIMAAKRTSELIPLSHSVPLGSVHIDVVLGESTIDIRARATAVATTGVEMEALTAASVAALAIYDMCKAIDHEIVIERVQLEEKSGGKGGDFRRQE